MSIRMIVGDCRAALKTLPADSVHCVVTSPPYWGLRDYGVAGQMGMEGTLGEHIEVMVDVFEAVRRVLRPDGTLWLNYGDCYATSPNGRSAAATKAAGTDDRTFRDKPFSTVGPIYESDPRNKDRRGNCSTLNGSPPPDTPGRISAGGLLKPKDLCMIPNRLAIALQHAGWWVRSEIVWGKPNAMPDSSGRYRPSTAHEKIFLLTKTGKSYYDAQAVRMPARGENSNGYPGSGGDGVRKRTTTGNYNMPDSWDTGEGAHGSFHRNGLEKGKRPDKQRGHSRSHAGFNDRWDHMTREEQQANGRLLRNYEPAPWECVGVAPCVWEIAIQGFREAHFATFPPALAATCIAAGCPEGGLVLDPFGGAGTVGMVADRMGRDAVLIELNPDYAIMAAERLRHDGGMYTDISVERLQVSDFRLQDSV